MTHSAVVVGPESEKTVFPDAFFQSLDIVVNALVRMTLCRLSYATC